MVNQSSLSSNVKIISHRGSIGSWLSATAQFRLDRVDLNLVSNLDYPTRKYDTLTSRPMQYQNLSGFANFVEVLVPILKVYLCLVPAREALVNHRTRM